MLDTCEEGTRYMHRKQFESAIVTNAFSVASAKGDERESCESRPGGETISLISCVGKLVELILFKNIFKVMNY